MSDEEDDRLFGEIALTNNMVTEEMLDECLRYQGDVDPDKVLGQILLEKGYITTEQIDLVLRIQSQFRTERERETKDKVERDQAIAETVRARGFASDEEIQECLRIQEKKRRATGKHLALGDILLRKKYITHSHLEIVKNVATGGDFPQIPGYKVLAELSKGGMAKLYRARHIKMDRVVALKVLDPKLCRNETHVRRFVREAQTAAKLSHPNLVMGYDVGEADGRHYFAMEYVNGESVLDWIKREGRIPFKAALVIVSQAAEALSYASRHHIIHRDVKPSNILIDHNNRAKLCDLGFAKSVVEEDVHLTIEGLTLGTPYYMSPEQAKGLKDLDVRTDIYALGATFYHMVVGRVPFTGRSPSEVMKKHLAEELVFPPEALESIPTPVVDLIRTMMEKDRNRRQEGYPALLETLGRLAEESGEKSSAQVGRIVEPEAAGSPGPRILVLVATRTGATRSEGEIVAQGVAEAGGIPTVLQVGEIDLERMVDYEGIIVGSPSYFGSAGHEIKRFFEDSERILGQLDGKIGAAFISQENIAIGRDRALFDIVGPMLYHGMLVRGDFNFLFDDNPSLRGARHVYEENCRKLGRKIAGLLLERGRSRG